MHKLERPMLMGPQLKENMVANPAHEFGVPEMLPGIYRLKFKLPLYLPQKRKRTGSGWRISGPKQRPGKQTCLRRQPLLIDESKKLVAKWLPELQLDEQKPICQEFQKINWLSRLKQLPRSKLLRMRLKRHIGE